MHAGFVSHKPRLSRVTGARDVGMAASRGHDPLDLARDIEGGIWPVSEMTMHL
jgi:hypothetical protein